LAKKASYESLQRRIRRYKEDLEAKDKEKEKLERKLREVRAREKELTR